MNELVSHTHERLALGAVILGGIAALIFGFSYLVKSVEDPLRLKPRTVKTPYEKEVESQALLRGKDTDSDGLSDYDEQFVWNTSPYLADTDSDSYPDKTEIDSGNDPNCPKGKDCGRGVIGNPDARGVSASIPEDLLLPQGSPDEINGLPGGFGIENLSAAEIRKLLIQYGVPEEQLNILTDEQIVELYQASVEKVRKQMEKEEL